MHSRSAVREAVNQKIFKQFTGANLCPIHSYTLSLLYIIGVAFGLVFWGLLSRMVKKEDYPLPDTPRKTVSVVRWICFAATILIGIILVLLFAGGFAITANGVPIIKTLTAFFIGDVIGAILIGLTLDFKATRYDFYRLANLLTGKKSE